MLIYQIYEEIGDSDDWTQRPIAAYLHRQKAEKELEKLTADADEKYAECVSCPYAKCLQDAAISTDCKYHAPIDWSEGDGEPAYSCQNLAEKYDKPTYKIKIITVDESEE